MSKQSIYKATNSISKYQFAKYYIGIVSCDKGVLRKNGRNIK